MGVAALLARADVAFEEMQKLDDGLYQRFVASRSAPDDSSTAGASLLGLWDDTFRGLANLLALCAALATSRQPLVEPVGELDFDELAIPRTQTEDEVDLALELGAIVDGIDVGDVPTEPARWGQLLEMLGTIEYGLRSQQHDAQERMKVALIAGQTNQVLGLLDDSKSAASEGVHALFNTIYRAFMPDADTATILPGYLTSLSRALLVRRGIAKLSSGLETDNQVLQSDRAERHDVALAAVRTTVRAFVRSAECHAMRPADRFQMVEFDRELHEQRLAAARTTSEGLVKYLDSLAMINQREVLVVHDRLAIDEMREAIANARELLHLSTRTASEMLVRAHEAARRLHGKQRSLDPHILALDGYAPTSSSATEISKLLDRLEYILVGIGT